jgi:hypothetical protein
MPLKPMWRACLVLVLLCTAGCAGIPLSTLIRLSTFDEKDFAKLDPDVVRARVALPVGFGLNVETSRIDVEVTSAAGVHTSMFELTEESVQTVNIPGDLFHAPTQRISYVFRLSDKSKSTLSSLQDFVGRTHSGSIGINIVTTLSSSPKGVLVVKIWTDLLLSKAQGYLRILDGTEVPV